MNKKLQEMFSNSSYSISTEKYLYVKVNKLPESNNYFMISQDNDEITVVCREDQLKELNVFEKNENYWRLVSLKLSIPFMAGTLAEINSACAKQGLNNLIISTYSKDYFIIKDPQTEQIQKTLASLGFKEKK